MKILNLSLKNFMNISEATITFGNNINLFFGKNGQGKSAAFEAIAFCLLDQKKGDTWKDYIKSDAKLFSVKLEVEDGESNIMKIAYEGRSSAGSLTKEIDYQGQRFTSQECNDLLERTFDRDMMKNVIFALQNSPLLTTFKASETRAIFKKIFNSEFPEIIDIIVADIAKAKEAVTTTRNAIKVLEAKTYNPHRIIDIEEADIAALREELKSSTLLEGDSKMVKVYGDKAIELKTATDTLNLLRKEKVDLTQRVADLMASKELLEALEITKKERVSVIAQEIEELKKNLQSKNDRVAEIQIELSTFQEAHKQELLDIASSKKTVLADINSTNADITLFKKYLHVHEQGNCTSCGHVCEPQETETLRKNILEKEEIKKKLLADFDVLDAQEQKIMVYRQQIESSKALLMPEIQTLTTSIVRKEGEHNTAVSEHKSVTEKIQSINKHQQPGLEAQVVSIAERIETLIGNIAALNVWLEANPVETSDVTSRKTQVIQQEIEDLLSTIAANAEKERQNLLIAKEKEKDTQELSSLNEKLNDQLKNQAIIEQAKAIIETDFPNYINGRACLILEKFMNNFFSSTKDKLVISIKPDAKGVSFFYKSDTQESWLSIKMASGYEAALITVAFNIAVARAFKSDFLFLDEPDKTADDESSQKLFETVLNIGGFKQNFIISHKDHIIEDFIEKGATVYNVSKGVFTKYN